MITLVLISGGERGQHSGRVAGAAHADDPVLSHRPYLGISDLARTHPLRNDIPVEALTMRRILLALHRAVLMISIVAGATGALAFDLQGHRGARGLAPENTLAAFETAIKIGVTTLELDIAMTKDDVLVVQHDLRLNPDTTRGPDGTFLNESGPAIGSLTLAELQRYDVGRINPTRLMRALSRTQRAVDEERIPTLTSCSTWSRASAPIMCASTSRPRSPLESGDDTPDPETFAARCTEPYARPASARA